MKKAYCILGIGLLFWGILVIINPKFYSYIYRRYLDFEEYHLAYGIFSIIGGILFIVVTLKSKSESKKEKLLICPKCEETIKENDITQALCLRCGVKLEQLVGFYDRHPELRGHGSDST
jgi:hypothetical protein